MNALVDADILIDIRRERETAKQWLDSLAEPPAIPGFVAMELLQGARDMTEQRRVQKFLSLFPIVWLTEEECGQAVDLFTAYRLSHNLGLVDSLVAALAVSRDLPLYTFNIKHYSVVPSLRTLAPHVRA